MRDWEASEVIAEVLVEPHNSVAFLKHRIWELTLASLPRCGQSLYDGDIELEDEHALEVYGLQSEHTIEYSPAWHEPYCPGCSDCDRNFCSACALYPRNYSNHSILWPEPRPYCSVCNHGPAPAEQAAASAAHSHTSEDPDSLESDMPEALAPAVTTVQPYESYSAPVLQLMIWRDILMNQPEVAQGWCFECMSSVSPFRH